MGLGFLRFILSLMVLDQHLGFYRQLILPKLVALIGIQNFSPIGGGAVAVSGFFVLSGYLIAHVLQGRYAIQGQPTVFRFYISRFLRILPLYWLVLLLMGLVYASLGLTGGFQSFWGEIQNGILLGFGWQFLGVQSPVLSGFAVSQGLLLPQVWTVSLDLWFYLFAPFILLNQRVRRISLLVGVLGLLVFVPMLPTVPQWFISFYSFGWIYWVAFLLGAELRLLQWHASTMLVFLSVLLIAMAAWFPVFLPPVFWQLLILPAFAVLVSRLGARKYTPPLDRFLGELTYAVYLLQLPILNALIQLGVPYYRWWTILLTFLGAILLSWVFERPLDCWRRKLDHILSRQSRPRKITSRASWVVAVLLFVPLLSYIQQHAWSWSPSQRLLSEKKSGASVAKLPYAPAQVLDTNGTVYFTSWHWQVRVCSPQWSNVHQLCVPTEQNRISVFVLPGMTLVGVDSIWVRAFPRKNTLFLEHSLRKHIWSRQLKPQPPLWKNVFKP